MENLKNIIRQDRPLIKDRTIDTYVRCIRILHEFGGKGQTLLEFLSCHKKVMNLVKEKYKTKTFKSAMTSIVVTLKAMKAPEELIKVYSDKLVQVADSILQQDLENEKSQTEQENWVSQAEIEDKIKQLKAKIDRDSCNCFDVFQQYLVLNLYFLIRPLRNDYIHVKVYNHPNQTPTTENPDDNLIILDKKKLILNNFKTFKFYGQKEIDLPDKLVDIISEWMSIRKTIYPELTGRRELLFNFRLKPMNQVNLTHYLNKIFGKKVSTTMLRKSYISEKYPVEATSAEMVKDADLMCHSVSVQQRTYRKKQF